MAFDVRGIAMFDGQHTMPSGFSFSDADLGDPELVNADGYTTLYNPATIDYEQDDPENFPQVWYEGSMSYSPFGDIAKVNGYRLFYSDPTSEPYDNPRHYFDPGAIIAQDYYVTNLPGGAFSFGYAVDACWAMPQGPPPYVVTDYISNANCPEPWKVSPTVFYVVSEGGLHDYGGLALLSIKVYDYDLSTNPDLDPETPDDPTAQLPTFECPDLFNGIMPGIYITSELEDPQDLNSFRYFEYHVTFSNLNLASAGEYKGLIRVEDPKNNPTGKPWLDLTAYQIVDLTVGDLDLTIESFYCSHADPALNDREVELFWSLVPGATHYVIEREDYDLNDLIWDWEVIFPNIPKTETSIIDTNCRYSGYGDASSGGPVTYGSKDSSIHYRIKAVNGMFEGEPYWSWGNPKPRNIQIAFFVVKDNNGNPPEDALGQTVEWDTHAKLDFKDCRQFWRDYGIEFSAPLNDNGTPDNYTDDHFVTAYDIQKTQYQNIDSLETGFSLHQYVRDYLYPPTDILNVYYVRQLLGSYTGGVFLMPGYLPEDNQTCSEATQDSEGSFIIIPMWGRNKGTFSDTSDDDYALLAHEVGHAIGRLYDLYRLDKWDDPDIPDYHPSIDCYQPGKYKDHCVPDNFWCFDNGCYPKTQYPLPSAMLNLMWYNYPGKYINCYDLYESQMIAMDDFISHNEVNWP